MELTTEAAVALEILSLILATVFVLLRGYVQIYLRAIFTASDVFVILAYIVFLVVFVTDILCLKVGEWKLDWESMDAWDQAKKILTGSPERESVAKLVFLAGPLDFVSLWFIKAAFLLFYFVLIPRAFRSLRILLWVTTVLTFTTGFTSVFMLLFVCSPIQRNWTYDGTWDRCVGYGPQFSYWFTIGAHAASDVLIYAIPFFLIPVLQLNKSRKVGLCIMFGLGFVSIAVGVIRVVLVYITGFKQSYVNSLSKLEIATGIMVVCTPPLKNLWRWYSSGMHGRTTTSGPFFDKEEELEWGTFRLGSSTIDGADIEHIEGVRVSRDSTAAGTVQAQGSDKVGYSSSEAEIH